MTKPATPEFVWVLTNYPFPNTPHVDRYRFAKHAKRGVMVWNRGALKWMPPTVDRDVFFTAKEAADALFAAASKRRELMAQHYQAMQDLLVKLANEGLQCSSIPEGAFKGPANLKTK